MTSPGDAARALEMRLAGADPQSIASATGFESGDAALAAVKAALDTRRRDSTSDAVATELARLDALMVGLWPRARRGEAAAIELVLKISDRRMRILAEASQGDADTARGVSTPLDELNRRRAARSANTKSAGRAKVAGK